MKKFYHFVQQLIHISHPASGIFSVTDLKKSKKKKTSDLPGRPSPDSFNVRGNQIRKQEWSAAGAP